jgi:NADH-quinone oxidoreductase subunit M
MMLSVGAIFLFCGVIYLIETTGITEINILSKYAFSSEQKKNIFTMLFIGFAFQTALFPLHIWLPDSHAKPPVAVSVIFSGVLLKIGIFGMMTILLPVTKGVDYFMQKCIFISAIITIAYATLAAFVQRDIKKTIAYISIIHTAIMVIGIFSYNVDGIFGAFFNMIAHSFIVTAMSVTVHIIENHFGKQRDVKGVSIVLPYFSKTALIPILAVISVPLLPCFVGNFLIISGSFSRHVFLSSFLCFLIAGSVLYGLKTYHRIFFGENNQKKTKLSNTECVCLYPVILCVFVMGVIPDKIFSFAKDELLKICNADPGL